MTKKSKFSVQSNRKESENGKKGNLENERPKEIMESILNAISDGIMVIDKEYKIALINRALAHEYGFDEPEESIGKKCYNVFRDRKKKCADCVATKVFKTGKTQHAYGSRKDAHGNELYLEIYAYPIFDDNGQVVKVVEYSRNITREKTLEDRLSGFMESATDAFVLFDSKLNFVEINKAGLKRLGLPKKDVIGKNLLEISPDLKKSGRHKKYLDVVKTGKPLFINDTVPHPKFGDIHLAVKAFKVGDGLGLIVTDITEQKKAEEALRDSEKRYRTLFEKSPTSITLLDKTGMILDCNKATERLIGFSKKEIVGKHFDKLLTLDKKDLPKMRENYKKLSKGQMIKPYELEIIKKDKKKRWINVRSSLVRKDNEVVGFQVISTDITERKQAEVALRESEELYRTLVETSPDGITLVDMDTNIIMTNARGAENLGYTLEEVQGMNAFSLMAPEDQPRIMDTVSELVEKGRIQNVEFNFIHKNGTRIPIEYNASIIMDEKGEPKYLLGVSRDLSERQKAEKQIRIANERLQYLLSSTSAVIYTAKASSNYGATFISENVTQLVGYKPKEFIGDSDFWIDHVHPEDKKRVLKEVSKLSKKGQHTYEYRFRNKKGNYIWMRDEMKLVRNNKDKPIEIVGYWLDITQRKEALKELKDSEEKYSNLFQKSNDAIFLHDLKGNILDMNQKVLDIFGFSKREAQKLNISDLHPKEALEKSKSEFEKISKKGYVNFEIDFKRKTGEFFPAEVSSSLFEIGGERVIQGIVRDITDRRKAEEAVRESEVKYRMLLEQSGDIITYFDTEGKLLAMNHNAARGLDGLPEDFIGKHLNDMFDKEIATNSLKRIHRVTQTQNDEEHEDMINLPTGKGWYRSNYHPMKDTENNVIGIQIISHDITERKQAEEEIKKLKEFNESIVQSMDEGILVMGEEGFMSFINPKMEKMLGYKRAKLVGEHWEKIIAPDFHRRMRDCYAENLKGEHDRFEAVLLKKNGTELPVLISATPQFKDNMFSGTLTVITDISQRKREEIAREELMKYKMKRGSTYLIKEKELERGKETVYELYKNHFNGLIITREHPEIIKKDIDLKLPLYYMTNDPKDKISVRPEFSLLEKIIDDHIDRNTFVFLDRFDYLVTQNSFNEALNFVQHLNEMFYARKAILIISLDPDTLNTQELSLLEKETSILEKRHEEKLTLDLIELLEFVNKRNLVGERPSYNDVGEEFRISRTTARKRIRELAERDLISERKSGRFKYLVLTEKGKDIL